MMRIWSSLPGQLMGLGVVLLLAGCVSIQSNDGAGKRSSPDDVIVVGSEKGRPEGRFWCPGDIPLSTVTRSGAHGSQTACETARSAANACNGVAVANPNTGCNNHCKQTLGCIGSVRNASTSVGDSCFPVDDGSGGEDWHYSCVATATCKCI